MMIQRPRRLAVIGAFAALFLFLASLAQVVIVKFPVEGEAARIEKILDREVNLSAESAQMMKDSLGYIRGNHGKVSAAYSRLYYIAAAGFLGLAVLFGLLSKSINSNRHENALASAREG